MKKSRVRLLAKQSALLLGSAGILVSVQGCKPEVEVSPLHPSVYREGGPFTDTQMMDLIEADAEMTLTHNREGWFSLFSEHAWVEEPNGTKPYAVLGRNVDTGVVDYSQFGLFYDSFMAPTTTVFDIEHAVYAGNTVIADVKLHTTYNNGVAVVVKNHIVYEFTEEAGQTKIDHVVGYYETADVQAQAEAQGLAGTQALLSLSANIKKYQGIAGLTNYIDSTKKGIFAQGKSRVSEFAAAFNAKDSLALSGLLASVDMAIEFPVNQAVLSVTEMLNVDADSVMLVGEMHSAGWATSFEFDLTLNGENKQGLGIIDFDPSSKKINKARFFWNQ